MGILSKVIRNPSALKEKKRKLLLPVYEDEEFGLTPAPSVVKNLPIRMTQGFALLYTKSDCGPAAQRAQSTHKRELSLGLKKLKISPKLSRNPRIVQ